LALECATPPINGLGEEPGYMRARGGSRTLYLPKGALYR
jgi:hypothetical protein